MSGSVVPASELMVKRGGSVNPAKFPDEAFELFSIPAFDKNQPEILKGSEIGSSKSCIEPGDVLLSKIVPHIRRCWVVPKKGSYRQIGSGEWIIFRDKRFDPGFLRHFFTSDVFHRQFMNTVAGVGGSLVRARPADVERIDIPLPPLHEQKRIANILDKADAIRRKRQQAIQLADEFLRAVFLDMFGDPVTNPKGWEFRNIGEFASIKNGYAFKSEYFSGEGDYVLLTPGNFYEKGGYRDRGNKQKFYSGPVPEGFVLKAGDVLLAMTEQAEGLLGSSLVVPSDKLFLHNQRLGLLKYDEKEVNRTFLAFLFNMASVRKLIHSTATGLKVRHTSPKKIQEIQVGLPDIYLQTRFSEIVAKIDSSICSMSIGKDTSTTMSKALSQKAFSGQL